MTDYVCGIDGRELTEKAVNAGAGSCYALHSQNANCRTCGYLKDVRAQEGDSMSYKFPVPDTSNIPTRPAFLIFPDRIPRMKQHICMTCSGKVEGFDTELSQKEFLISGMCQICQNQAFCADDEQ